MQQYVQFNNLQYFFFLPNAHHLLHISYYGCIVLIHGKNIFILWNRNNNNNIIFNEKSFFYA